MTFGPTSSMTSGPIIDMTFGPTRGMTSGPRVTHVCSFLAMTRSVLHFLTLGVQLVRPVRTAI